MTQGSPASSGNFPSVPRRTMFWSVPGRGGPRPTASPSGAWASAPYNEERRQRQRQGKEPGIDLLVPAGMADVLHRLHILFPHMPGDRLDMALAVGASPEARAAGAVGPAALILPVSLPICCAVCQDLSLWADITVVVLIIYVLILLKKPIFCHRPFIRQQWQDTVREQSMGDRRRP